MITDLLDRFLTWRRDRASLFMSARCVGIEPKLLESTRNLRARVYAAIRGIGTR